MNTEAALIEWAAYYNQFPYFTSDSIRPGCYPRIHEQPGGSKNAIVLVHGLTDSPYFLTAIAGFFYHELGFNVYLPLLQGHGLKQPRGMADVELSEWKKNVSFAIDVAAGQSESVSVGGLSAGGTLSFYMAARNPAVTGNLYLFSAALDIAGGIGGFTGELKERLLRSYLAELLAQREHDRPLIGVHPYRYARMDKDGAIELGKLILETDVIIAEHGPENLFDKLVFAAHSASDRRADFSGIRALQQIVDPANFSLFYIPESYKVPHASVVLKEPIYVPDADAETPPLEPANPLFDEMMEAVAQTLVS